MEMTQFSTPEQKLTSLGLILPQLPAPGGNYVSAKRVGDLVYLAGAVSPGPAGVIAGTAGAGSTIDDGYAAARACVLTQLAVLKRDLPRSLPAQCARSRFQAADALSSQALSQYSRHSLEVFNRGHSGLK